MKRQVAQSSFQWIDEEEATCAVDAADVVNLKDFASQALCEPNERLMFVQPPNAKNKNEEVYPGRVYTFEMTQQEAIFYHLLNDPA